MSTKNTAPADTKVEGLEPETTEATEAKPKRAPRASTVERLEQALIDAKAKESVRDDTGRVSAEAMGEFVGELFTALAPNS